MREEQRQVALKTLQQAIELTAQKTKNKSLVIERKGDTVIVGRYRIVKKNGFLNIYESRKLLYKDVLLIETAMGVIERILRKKQRGIAELLAEDANYAKHYIDMKYYMRSFNNANPEDRYIFQDRYLVSKDKARTIRSKIERLRIPS